MKLEEIVHGQLMRTPHTCDGCGEQGRRRGGHGLCQLQYKYRVPFNSTHRSYGCKIILCPVHPTILNKSK